MSPMLSRRFRPPHPVDLVAVFLRYRRGAHDPTMRVGLDGVWRATRTPEGAVTTHFRATAGEVRVRAWGEGAEWAVEHAPAVCGALDDATAFTPRHPVVRDLHRRLPGLRLGATGTVFEAMVPTVLEQKVVGAQARRAWAAMVRALGDPAPAFRSVPHGLRLPPTPEALATTPSYRFHRWNVEAKRADTIRRVAGCASALDRCTAVSRADAYRMMASVPGIGPWTAAEVGVVALGDPDAVSVGDYHLPHTVSWALAGEPRGSDERMLELLEPFRGHRGRVIRLIEAAGIRAPRYAPRLPLVDITGI